VAEDARPRRQPQAGAAADADDGPGSDLPAAAHERTGGGSQGLSLPPARACDRAGEPGVGGGHHLHPDGARLPLSGRGDGLGEPVQPALGLDPGVLAWRLSNTLDTRFCVDALEDALAQGRPDIFNTDQGCQFTAVAFTGTLAAAGVAISMDGRGRWMDNVFVERLWRSLKYEEVYLHAYDGPADAKRGIAAWIEFYNTERPHQALGDRTPAAVFAAGASPVDLWTTQGRCPQTPQAPQPQQILYDDNNAGIAIMRRARLTTAETASTRGGFHLIPA